MMMNQRNRNGKHSKFYQGPGGRHCDCCDFGRKWNKRTRRYIRRIEKQEWKNVY